MKMSGSRFLLFITLAFIILFGEVMTQVCGDGITDAKSENCDDGNTVNGDGCSSRCLLEFPWQCAGAPSKCYLCGDGNINDNVETSPETCDDGNSNSGDGCSSSCGVESSFTCVNIPSICFECGNGYIDPVEGCDDGNANNGDGCESCQIASGWTCTGSPSKCRKCGNGVLEEGEECEDGNANSGDGCSSSCEFEAGFTCTGTNPTSCSALPVHSCDTNTVTVTSGSAFAVSDGSAWNANYAKNMECVIRLIPSKANGFVMSGALVTFAYFDTEPDRDVFRLYEGDQVDTPSYTFSGTTAFPPTLAAVPKIQKQFYGTALTITFSTDSEVERKGFLFDVQPTFDYINTQAQLSGTWAVGNLTGEIPFPTGVNDAYFAMRIIPNLMNGVNFTIVKPPDVRFGSQEINIVGVATLDMPTVKAATNVFGNPAVYPTEYNVTSSNKAIQYYVIHWHSETPVPKDLGWELNYEVMYTNPTYQYGDGGTFNDGTGRNIPYSEAEDSQSVYFVDTAGVSGVVAEIKFQFTYFVLGPGASLEFYECDQFMTETPLSILTYVDKPTVVTFPGYTKICAVFKVVASQAEPLFSEASVGHIPKDGFQLSWTAIKEGVCSGVKTFEPSCAGYFYSGTTIGSTCGYEVSTPAGSLRLDFSKLTLGANDYLTIYNGTAANPSVVQANVTASTLISTITLAGKSAYLLLKANGTSYGFRGNSNGSCLSDEDNRGVLEKFYDALGGPSWKTATNWKSSKSPCTWFGVGCVNGQVVSLILSDNNLVGEIPDDLSNLRILETVKLSSNSIGSLPRNMDKLALLTHLDVSLNAIKGAFPSDLTDLGNLVHLNMSHNRFTGALPSTWGNNGAAALKVFSVAGNMLSGDIPAYTAQWEQLETFDISANEFSGGLPTTMFSLPKLTVLNLAANAFEDVFPSLANLSVIASLDFSENKITGNISETLCTRYTLQVFQAGMCEISGSIPSCLGNLSRLVTFSVPGNAISGNLSDIYSTMVSLKTLDVSANSLGGNLPASLFNGMLETVRLRGNHFQGPVPANLNDKIITLDLSDNKFSGTYPGWAGATNLLNVGLAGLKDMSGAMPASLNSLPLEGLDLSSSSVGGSFPSDNNWKTMTVLKLSYTNMDIQLTEKICSMTALKSLGLRKVSLTGEVPRCLFDLQNLESLDLGNNNLSSISPMIELPKLKVLKADNNILSGPLPCVRTWKALESVDLSGNPLATDATAFLLDFSDLPSLSQLTINNAQLHGTLRIELAVNGNLGTRRFPNLRILDLSYNQISGSLSAWMAMWSQLNDFSLQSNSLTGALPVELSGITLIDISLNSMVSVELSRYDVSSGNLNSLLPTFANFDASIPNANATGHFTCSSVVNVLTKTVIEMDQSYYGYYACACDAGYYGEYNQCYECPASNAICSNGKINCIAGSYGPTGGECLDCPDNAECDGKTIQSLEGYWAPLNSRGEDRTKSSQREADQSADGEESPMRRRRLMQKSQSELQGNLDNFTTEFFACHHPSRCLPDSSCVNGTEGHLCGVCAFKDEHGIRWHPSGDTCVPCPSIFTILLAIFLAAVAAIVGVEILFLPVEQAKRKSAKAKILISFFQILATMVIYYDVQWPEFYSSAISWSGIFSLNISSILAIDCLRNGANMTFYHTFFINMWFPILFTVIVVLQLVIGVPIWYYLSRRTRVKFNEFMWLNLCTRNFLFLLLFIHPTLSSSVLQIFQCENVGGTYLLSVDLSQECFTPEWFFWASVAAFFFLVYVVGIPISILVVLVFHRNKLDEEATFNRLGGLYGAYQSNVFYWEVVEIYRKLFLVGVIIFILPGTLLQIAVALAVCFVALMMNEMIRPYNDRSDSWLAFATLSQLCIILYAMMIFKYYQDAAENDGNDPTIIMAFLIGLQLLGLVLVVIVLFGGTYQMVKNAWHDFLESNKGRRLALTWDLWLREAIQSSDIPESRKELYQFIREHHTLPYVSLLPHSVFVETREAYDEKCKLKAVGSCYEISQDAEENTEDSAMKNALNHMDSNGVQTPFALPGAVASPFSPE